MSAYVIFIRTGPTDRTARDLRTSCARAVLGHHTLDPRADGEASQAPEDWPAESIVILPFPDITSARAWSDSPAYHAARAHRLHGADYRVILTEGVSPGSSIIRPSGVTVG